MAEHYAARFDITSVFFFFSTDTIHFFDDSACIYLLEFVSLKVHANWGYDLMDLFKYQYITSREMER